MQYFEKSRIEWHPGNAEPYRVQLGLLGDDLGKRRRPSPSARSRPPTTPTAFTHLRPATACAKNSANTGFRTAAWTGLASRSPNSLSKTAGSSSISSAPAWSGTPRNSTRRSKSSWRRWAGYFIAAGLDPDLWCRRIAGDILGSELETVTSLRPRASVFKPVTVANGAQTAFVYVTDQLGRPTGGAGVTLVLHYPDRDEAITLSPTSATGTSFTTFIVPEIAAGTIVSMEFIATYAGVFGRTRTSYMVWY